MNDARNDPANPLEPGDAFKKKNFSKFALGMMLLAVIIAALVSWLFLAHR